MIPSGRSRGSTRRGTEGACSSGAAPHAGERSLFQRPRMRRAVAGNHTAGRAISLPRDKRRGFEDYVSNRFRGHTNFRTLNHASSFPLELMLAMGAMLVGGVLEKFPALRMGLLEGNCGWLPWWLHRLDDQWESMAAANPRGCQPCRANISRASVHRH